MEAWKRLVNNYFGWNDKETIPPAGGFRRVGYIILNYPEKLFVINLIFIVSCIPVVTIPAAIIALNRYLSIIFGRGYNFSRKDYWMEFKSSLLKRIPLGLCVGFIMFYGYYLMSLAGNFSDQDMASVVMGIGITFFAVGSVIGGYLFFMSALLDLGNKALLKNAFMLILVEWKKSLGVLIVVLISAGVLVAFLPYSLYLLLIGFFAIEQLCICAFLYPVVKKRIVEPYEKQAK